MDLSIGRTSSKDKTTITAWIDTAFNGYLVCSKQLIDDLGLEIEATTEAILADGSRVVLESYVCEVDWLGEMVRAQVIANEGSFPLLSTELLAQRKLVVDYGAKTVTIS